MGKNNEIEINEQLIKKDLEKFIDTFGKTLASKVADKSVADAKAVLEEFYLDYQPRYYNRTFDLLNNSYHRYYKNHTTTFYGGVILSSKRMRDYKNTPKQDVFNWTILDGYHGYNWYKGADGERVIDPITSRPPISKLMERIYDKPSFEQLKKEALKEAEKGNYKTLRFKKEN